MYTFFSAMINLIHADFSQDLLNLETYLFTSVSVSRQISFCTAMHHQSLITHQITRKTNDWCKILTHFILVCRQGFHKVEACLRSLSQNCQVYYCNLAPLLFLTRLLYLNYHFEMKQHAVNRLLHQGPLFWWTWHNNIWYDYGFTWSRQRVKMFAFIVGKRLLINR